MANAKTAKTIICLGLILYFIVGGAYAAKKINDKANNTVKYAVLSSPFDQYKSHDNRLLFRDGNLEGRYPDSLVFSPCVVITAVSALSG